MNARERRGRRAFTSARDLATRPARDRGSATESTAIPMLSAACTWAIDPDLTTLFVSPRFARLIGLHRLVVAGLPWFSIVAGGSHGALEWLVSTSRQPASALLELRHLDGSRHHAVAYRVYGGPGKEKAVFRIFPLGSAADLAEGRRDVARAWAPE